MKKILSLFILTAAFSVSAVEGVERELLMQFVETLDVAERLVVEAKRESSEVVNSPVEYQKLIADVSQVSNAIRRHVHSPAVRPLAVEPLYLSYTIKPNEFESAKFEQVLRALDVAKGQALEAAALSTGVERVGVQYQKLVWDVSELSFAVSKIVVKTDRQPRAVAELYTEYKQ
jgi:RAQPRD family integrative conjugative element protein